MLLKASKTVKQLRICSEVMNADTSHSFCSAFAVQFWAALVCTVIVHVKAPEHREQNPGGAPVRLKTWMLKVLTPEKAG